MADSAANGLGRQVFLSTAKFVAFLGILVLLLGTLRQALLYPFPDQKVEEEKIRDALVRCGLEHLFPRLDEAETWSQVLSGGEQQRLAFARVMIRPFDILIMDEPTSSLDELSQFRMMEYMRDFLPETTVIHAGHRPGLEVFHNREIKLVRERRGGPATTKEDKPKKKKDQPKKSTMFSRAWRRFGGRRASPRAANGGIGPLFNGSLEIALARNQYSRTVK